MKCPDCGFIHEAEDRPEYAEDLFTYYNAVIETIDQRQSLCVSCLRDRVNKKLEHLIAALPPDDLLQYAEQYRFMGKPIPGLDFYMEGEKRVSKAWHHIKRGRCCSSGCRHCPYPLI